jgi:hypothetical protein
MTAFHAMLESVIKDYADGIRSGADKKARTAFRRKMDFICRVEAQASLEASPDND